MTIQNPVLWDAKHNPYLYTVNVELYDGNRLVDKVTEQTGFRYFSIDPDKGFFLNGKPYDIHGFCRHEDVEGKGSALLPEDYDKDMELIKEVGATGIRLTHYPHAKECMIYVTETASYFGLKFRLSVPVDMPIPVMFLIKDYMTMHVRL